MGNSSPAHYLIEFTEVSGAVNNRYPNFRLENTAISPLIPHRISPACCVWAAVESVALPPRLKKLEPNAFQNCHELKHFDFPDGLETLGEECFASSGLEEVTLPSTLKEIGCEACKGCRFRVVYVRMVCAVDVRKSVGASVEVRHV